MAAFAGLSAAFRGLMEEYCPWCFREDYLTSGCPERYLDFVETYAGESFISQAVSRATYLSFRVPASSCQLKNLKVNQKPVPGWILDVLLRHHYF